MNNGFSTANPQQSFTSAPVFPLQTETKKEIEAATKAQTLSRTIAQKLKSEIHEGRWKQGDKLPAVRALTRNLEVCHVTVIRALEDLVAQGYIRVVSGRGSYVTYDTTANGSACESQLHKHSTSGSIHQAKSTIIELSDLGNRVILDRSSSASKADSILHAEAPNTKLLELIAKQARLLPLERGECDPTGNISLRAAISSYVRRQRQINCEPEHIVLFPNRLSALDQISRLLIRSGDSVAVENPGCPESRRCFIANGASLHGVSVDEQGLSQEELHQKTSHRLLFIKPFQYPTTVAVATKQQEGLLAWASNHNSLIVEDESDNQLFFGSSLPSLKSADLDSDSVVYIGGFPHTISSIVPIAFAIMPQFLAQAAGKANAAFGVRCSDIEQRALMQFIDDGSLERHFMRLKTSRGLKRAQIVSQLTLHLRDVCTVSCPPAGTHLLLRFSDRIDVNLLEESFRSAGLALTGQERYMTVRKRVEYRLGFIEVDLEHLPSQLETLRVRLSKTSEP